MTFHAFRIGGWVSAIRIALFLVVTISGTSVAAVGRSGQASEDQWRIQHETGLAALRQGRYDAAVRSLRAAVREAEDIGADDYRLGESLGALAQTYNWMGRYAEAEAAALRSLDILDPILHPQDPVLAIQKNNLAEAYLQLDRIVDAQRLFRESLPVLETALGASHPDVLRSIDRLAAIALDRGNDSEASELYARLLVSHWGIGTESSAGETLDRLERLATVLSLAHFPDAERERAIQALTDSVQANSLTPIFYVAMSRMLARQQLVTEAESVMLEAVRRFPDARDVRTELAELYADNKRLHAALEVFEEASRMDAPPDRDAAADRYEQWLLQVRIGNMNVELGRFDDAVTAFERALEIEPEATIARLELAGQYLVRGMLEEAQEEYALIVEENPGTADAHYGLAELYLRLDRFDDAAAAAQRALAIQEDHQRARYARVRALIRSGRDAEGRQELATYQEREAVADAARNDEVEESALHRSAAALLIAGRGEEAVAMLTEGIQARPGAALIYLNLGVALIKLGRHDAAVQTFQRMLELGCCPAGDAYLVYWNLANVYAVLGEADQSLRNRALFLREYDRALTAALDRR